LFWGETSRIEAKLGYEPVAQLPQGPAGVAQQPKLADPILCGKAKASRLRQVDEVDHVYEALTKSGVRRERRTPALPLAKAKSVMSTPVKNAAGTAEHGSGEVARRPSFGHADTNGFVEFEPEIALDRLDFEIERDVRGIAFPNVFIKIAH
jgi:hypothetical protein